MAAFGSDFNPSSVLMGRPTTGTGAYLWTGAGKTPPTGGGSQMTKPQQQTSGLPAQTTVPAAPGNVVGSEAIRATGSGPFDPSYRQNLASYAAGQFARPGGSMSFNPTDISTFPGMPTGGGTAPVTGMPQSLLDLALSGRGFSFAPPPPAQAATPPPKYGDMSFWMDQFMRGGRGQRMGSFL